MMCGGAWASQPALHWAEGAATLQDAVRLRLLLLALQMCEDKPLGLPALSSLCLLADLG